MIIKNNNYNINYTKKKHLNDIWQETLYHITKFILLRGYLNL